MENSPIIAIDLKTANGFPFYISLGRIDRIVRCGHMAALTSVSGKEIVIQLNEDAVQFMNMKAMGAI